MPYEPGIVRNRRRQEQILVRLRELHDYLQKRQSAPYVREYCESCDLPCLCEDSEEFEERKNRDLTEGKREFDLLNARLPAARRLPLPVQQQ